MHRKLHLFLFYLCAAGALACLACLGCAGPAPSPQQRVAFLARTGPYWQVWTMAPDGSRQRQLTDSAYEKATLSWFPDGRSLLVGSLDGQLVRVDASSGVETAIATGGRSFHDPAVSPSGTRIAAAARGELPSGRELFLLSLQTGEVEQLTRQGGMHHQPNWSPDGRWLYFASGFGGNRHGLSRLALGDGSLQDLTASARLHFEPDVSPDERLAYSSNRSGDYEIWLRDLGAGSQPIQLTQSPGLDGAPVWSPAGDEIIFHSTRSGQLDLWRLALDGGRPERLTQSDSGARSAAWWGQP
jgi:TolB protein